MRATSMMLPRELVVEENAPFTAELHAQDLHRLACLLGGAWQTRNGTYVVAHVVGHVALPSGLVLRIRSKKAPVASVMAWSSYVDPLLADLHILGELETSAQEADVATVVARVFLAVLAKAVSRDGLARRYQQSTAVSASVRGRIDFTRLVRQAGDASRVPCLIWERRPSSPAMRLLAATLTCVARDPVMRAAAPAQLEMLLRAFAEVSPQIDPVLLAGRAQVERNEQGYSLPVTLARFIVRSVGLAEGSETDGLSYLVGMNVLFERAVVRALNENGVLAHAKWPLRHERVHDDGACRAGVSPMELDAFCPNIGQGGLVVDAKYKDSISSANLQQMLAYCMLTGATHGVLAVPAGLLSDRRSFRFSPAAGKPVMVHLVEFDVRGKTVNEWRVAASEFAGRVRTAVGARSLLER